jgi:spermidine synthase
MSPPRPARAGGAPYVHRGWRYVELRFREDVTQTRMLRWAPDWLQVGYTRTMLAALLLQPRPARIGIIGLGGGAQAKFCHRYLAPARIDVVENEAGVLALREAFRIPADDARLQVVLGDGAAWLRAHRACFDLLLVDAYDLQGIPPALSTQAFYRDCRAALRPGGAMATNLYATDLRTHVLRLRRAFDGRARVLEEPGMDNRVAFAWCEPRPATTPAQVLAGLPWLARRQLARPMRRLAAALAR